MTKVSLAQLPAKLYELLAPLTAEDRNRVIQATMILFGQETPAVTSTSGGDPNPNHPQAFLNEKDPKNKGEILAVAARYRELSEKVETHSKVDLKKVITASRRNFDDSNFARDINNAKRQAGFFNLGAGRDASRLSSYGQQYVDALPDRDAASKLRRPKVGSSRKKKKVQKK